MAQLTVKCAICGAQVEVEAASLAEAQEIHDAQEYGDCDYYCEACQPRPNQSWN
jgi:uncharacterized protein YciI